MEEEEDGAHNKVACLFLPLPPLLISVLQMAMAEGGDRVQFVDYNEQAVAESNKQ